jgi:hypothetical protein
MRDDEVARAGGLPDAASPSSKELDRRIDIVAADSARAPDSHVRRQLLFRLIRCLCRAMRRRPNRIVANQAECISIARCHHMEPHVRAVVDEKHWYLSIQENLAGRLCWEIGVLPASEPDKSVQHDSRCANVPNCTRRADLRFDCGAPQQLPAIAPRARHFRHRRL